MKTYQEFREAAALAAPLVGLGVRAAAPFVTGAIGAAANLMKAKQTQPRTPNLQRGRLNSNDAYNRQKQQERKAEARARAAENQTTGQGELGRKADEILQKERQLAKDAEYAKQRRENPALRDAEAKQRVINNRRAAQAERMRKAADKLGLD